MPSAGLRASARSLLRGGSPARGRPWLDTQPPVLALNAVSQQLVQQNRGPHSDKPILTSGAKPGADLASWCGRGTLKMAGGPQASSPCHPAVAHRAAASASPRAPPGSPKSEPTPKMPTGDGLEREGSVSH